MDKGRGNQRPEEDGGGDDEYGTLETADIIDEDDNPEGFPTHGGHPTWAYPDLLNVPNSNSVVEDDPPESQLPFPQRIRQSIQNNANCSESVGGSGHSSSAASANSSSSRSNVQILRRETGAIPKTSRQHVALPPDVSLSGPSTSAASAAIAPQIPLSRNDLINFAGQGANLLASVNAAEGPGGNSVGGRGVNGDRERVVQLERDVISLQTQREFLQKQLSEKNNHIRELKSTASTSEPVSSSFASVAASVAAIQASMETMARDVTERLNRLESRLNMLTVNSNQSNTISVLDEATVLREQLRTVQEQQRQEIQQERADFMVNLSDALRAASMAASSKGQNQTEKRTNGPQN